MTIKHKDFALVFEVVNNMRAKRHAVPLASRDVAEMISALQTCGWTIIQRGDLETLHRFVRRLEGRE